jgi:hypothetical protein
VIDAVHPFHQPRRQAGLGDVAGDYFQTWVIRDMGQTLDVPIDRSHPVPFRELAIDQMAADKAAAAGNQNLRR